jgi:hypothetical protein
LISSSASDRRRNRTTKPEPFGDILEPRILGINALELAAGLCLAALAIVEQRTLISDLSQQLVRAILAPPERQREDVDRRIGQAQADQRAGPIEQQRRMDRSLVFDRRAQLCDASQVLGIWMIERKFGEGEQDDGIRVVQIEQLIQTDQCVPGRPCNW